MGFRNPITTAAAVDTGEQAPGVRIYASGSNPASGIVEWHAGGADDARITFTSSATGSGGSSFSIAGGNDQGVTAPALELNVEQASAGGYQAAARLSAPLVVSGRLTLATLTPAAGWTIASGRGLAVVADGADYALDGLIQNTSAFTPNGSQVLLSVGSSYAPKVNRFFLIPVYDTAQVVLCHLTTAGQLLADISTGQIPASSFWDLSRVVWDPTSTN